MLTIEEHYAVLHSIFFSMHNSRFQEKDNNFKFLQRKKNNKYIRFIYYLDRELDFFVNITMIRL